MTTTSPMMDAAAATTALQEEPRSKQQRKLVARKSCTGTTSSCLQKSTMVTPVYNTSPRDPEHTQSPPQRTHLSYSAVTGHAEGNAAVSRSDCHRKRKRHGSVSSDTCSERSSSIAAVEASSETIHFEDIVGHIAAKVQIEDILYSLDTPTESIDDSRKHEFTYLSSQPTSILMSGPPGVGKVN